MARLSIRGPLSAKRVHDLTDDVTTVGRATTNTIQIESPGTSREHCKIEKAETGYRVVDCGSRNGTKINGNIVESHDLRPGDVITVGKHTLTFDPRESAGEVDNLATMTLADGATDLGLGPPPEERAPEPPKKDDKVLRALMGFPQGDTEVAEPEGGGALKYVVIVLVGLLVVGGLAALLILKRMKAKNDSPAPEDAPTPAATSTP
ncbi:MAG: FHA domain-containing protein [Planctomycetota bacterium]